MVGAVLCPSAIESSVQETEVSCTAQSALSCTDTKFSGTLCFDVGWFGDDNPVNSATQTVAIKEERFACLTGKYSHWQRLGSTLWWLPKVPWMLRKCVAWGERELQCGTCSSCRQWWMWDRIRRTIQDPTFAICEKVVLSFWGVKHWWEHLKTEGECGGTNMFTHLIEATRTNLPHIGLSAWSWTRITRLPGRLRRRMWMPGTRWIPKARRALGSRWAPGARWESSCKGGPSEYPRWIAISPRPPPRPREYRIRYQVSVLIIT